MADQKSQDIKELQESLCALEESLAAISQKQDSQFEELNKKLILLINSRTSPLSTADSESSAQLSSSELVDTDLKTAGIPRFDGSTEDEDHKHHLAEEEETRSILPPSPPPTWKYDVFVSFRGTDTRRGFVSHLFQAFKSEGINCYRDVDGNERGQEVEKMLIEAIHQSKMAIVLLSQNYADSKWCLKELVEILRWNEQYRSQGHMVLPIFYGVSAYDVKHVSGMVGKAYVKCIENCGGDKNDLWKNAIMKAGRISSWTSSSGDEASMVKEIVEVLLKRVAYSRSPGLVKSSIVPNDNLSHLCSMLDTTRNDVVLTVGVCGTEGIGKTTLANAACVHLHKVFDGRVIMLEDIAAMETQTDLLQIQSKIATELLKDKWFQMSKDGQKNFLEIRMKLSQMKVLIVLDNVTTLLDVELVLGNDYEKFLYPRSRVVITTRDWGLLDKLKVDDIYMVAPLDHEHSLKLFYHYAFMGRQESSAIQGYEELSKNIVHYGEGLPQVLETLGNSLSNAPETEWYTKLHELVGSRSRGDSKLYKCGPFGGRGKVVSRWDDGEHGDVRGIKLVIVDSVIKSISVTYDNYGHPVGPLFHGCSSSSSTVLPETIELDYPYEYLTGISGYIGKNEATKVTTVCSLTLYSNTRRFGPYGDQSKTGQPFSTQQTGAKIVGFFGAGDSELQHIGVHAKQVSHTYPHHQVVGPFGQNDGAEWNHGAFTDIRKIIITLDKTHIVSISCVYDNNGLPVEKLSDSSRSSMYKQEEVTLNYPTEFILSMSGCYGQDGDDSPSYVKSLTFRTNLNTHGPYGSGTGLTFGTPLELGKIVGFYGTQVYGTYFQSIGAYLAPVYHMHPLTSIEPFGDVFNKTWDDGKHSGVDRIEIHHGQSIYYMRFTYVDGNGHTVQGREFGSPDLDGFGVKEVIKLDYPKEYLVSIFGRMGSYYESYPSETNYITSLSFETNLNKVHGLYGEIREWNKPFSFKSNIAKIVGFHGTDDTKSSGAYSIGPHLQLL